MIILEELCRNNLVLSDTYGLCIVVGIAGDKVQVNNGSYDVSEKFYELNPVEITEDLLLKFGFEIYGLTATLIDYINRNGKSFFISKALTDNRIVKTNKWYTYNFIEIEYFHNLQNYYRIVTGGFLNIDIKKIRNDS